VVSFTFVVVASCWSSSGNVESSVLLLLHARTHLKQKKKKICTCYQSCCLNEEGRYIWYQSGSTQDLGFTTGFVDMIMLIILSLIELIFVCTVIMVRGRHGGR
jgi:hypothetical protein